MGIFLGFWDFAQKIPIPGIRSLLDFAFGIFWGKIPNHRDLGMRIPKKPFQSHLLIKGLKCIPNWTEDEFQESRDSRPFPRNDLKFTPCKDGLVIFGTENSTLGRVGLEIREIFCLRVGRVAPNTSDGSATEPDAAL